MLSTRQEHGAALFSAHTPSDNPAASACKPKAGQHPKHVTETRGEFPWGRAHSVHRRGKKLVMYAC